MPLRLIEIILPASEAEKAREAIDKESVIGFWQEQAPDSGTLIKMLLDAGKTEEVLDQLEQQFSSVDGYRVVLLPVEATLPRYKANDEEPSESDAPEKAPEKMSALRVSREELYSDISDSIAFSRVFVAMVVLSAIVAAVGLLRNNVAVVIGAMVIAPLLGPNVGLAFATTLGDFKMMRAALITNLIGFGIALGLAVLAGIILPVDVTTPEIASRTQVHMFDIVLALASGSAGVLAFTSGVSTALIGVMVAVALLPPLVAFGLLLGAGNFGAALGALLLLLTNVICVNLAGVTTFLVQGIQPRRWWEAGKARRATRIAIALWSALLIILAILIVLSQQDLA